MCQEHGCVSLKTAQIAYVTQVQIMRCKNIIIVFVCICFFGSLKLSYASNSQTNTYQFHWDDGQTHVFDWNVTAPLYASPSSPMALTLGFHVDPTGGVTISSLRLEVTAILDNGSTEQVFYAILLQGSYSVGFDKVIPESITVPSNAMVGSSLNVSVYTDVNRWFLYPTEIENTSYGDLQAAYDNAQSQISSLNQTINSLNQQVANLNQQISNLNQELANLPSENTMLNQEVANLTADKMALNNQIAALDSQVSSLQNQSTIRTIVIPLIIAAIAVAAGAVAVYMFSGKRKLARANIPQHTVSGQGSALIFLLFPTF